jgi:hypothetical protein
VGVLCCMGVRRGLRMGVRGGRWRRGRRRWQVFASLVDDAQLHDGRRVDWSTIGADTAHPGLLRLLSYAEVVLAGAIHGCVVGRAQGNCF